MSVDSIDYSNIPFYDDTHAIVTIDDSSLVINRIKTPFGELLAGASTKGICLLEFTDTNRIAMQLSRLKKAPVKSVIQGTSEYFAALNTQLQDYFSGKLQTFDIPLDIQGTDFQRQVWDALQTIPYGETRSYQQQAIAINHPKAVRAVANANRNNKISIIIPCHRVIGKNGSMTGYGGGIWRKEYLLALEMGEMPDIITFPST
ncbi:MAG: cysteine methyltransferase [Aquificaceae bacterium]|nr:MAG: cysteine methyltransferase [Aquificaceae bacterium]